jgi:hypothetical protein
MGQMGWNGGFVYGHDEVEGILGPNNSKLCKFPKYIRTNNGTNEREVSKNTKFHQVCS